MLIFEKSRPGEFDVILMDIMMPVMNGYNATKRIRSMDREDAKEIPIIAMTANAFTEDRIRAKEAGMDEHISKPVDGNLLVKVIHELLMMVISISLLSGCGSKNAEKEDAETNELNSGMNSIDYNAISGQLTIIMVAFKEGWIHRDHWIF